MPKPRPTKVAALHARADKQLAPSPKEFNKAQELEALPGPRARAPAGKKAAAKVDVASVAQVLADVHVTAEGTVVGMTRKTASGPSRSRPALQRKRARSGIS